MKCPRSDAYNAKLTFWEKKNLGPDTTAVDSLFRKSLPLRGLTKDLHTIDKGVVP